MRHKGGTLYSGAQYVALWASSCGASIAERHLGITLSVVRPSVCRSVTPLISL